ncbi:hypothetical protein AAG906_032699 [Vitis piasezkii]
MVKDSSPISSHFPMTRRYSSSMTHHILEKVCSQAHKCGEKGIHRPLAPAPPASLAPPDSPTASRPSRSDITEQDPHTTSLLLDASSDLYHDTPTPLVTPTPAYAESSSGHPSLPLEFELSSRPFTH